MEIIFIFLSLIIIAFLLMLCLTLFRIEKTLTIALLLAEKKIVKTYGRK